jgi:hypothetical protein
MYGTSSPPSLELHNLTSPRCSQHGLIIGHGSVCCLHFYLLNSIKCQSVEVAPPPPPGSACCWSLPSASRIHASVPCTPSTMPLGWPLTQCSSTAYGKRALMPPSLPSFSSLSCLYSSIVSSTSFVFLLLPPSTKCSCISCLSLGMITPARFPQAILYGFPEDADVAECKDSSHEEVIVHLGSASCTTGVLCRLHCSSMIPVHSPSIRLMGTFPMLSFASSGAFPICLLGA